MPRCGPAQPRRAGRGPAAAAGPGLPEEFRPRRGQGPVRGCGAWGVLSWCPKRGCRVGVLPWALRSDPADRISLSLFPPPLFPPYLSPPMPARPVRLLRPPPYAPPLPAQGPPRAAPPSSRPSCTCPPNCAGSTGRAGAGCFRRGRQGRGGTGRRGGRRGAPAPCPPPPRGTR